MSDFIKDEFYKRMKKINLNVHGILDADMKIHSLGTDSKIIGRVFEMLTQPILEGIANDYGFILKTPESQTVYPDFIMMKSSESDEKIAIDVKSTYIDNDKSTIKFTLGSFASYMRNNTKNIEYQYTDYLKHYVIGFIYKRNGAAQESKVYDISHSNDIIFPYYDVKFFIQEKYKIAGDKPGSGNTENIGSFKTASFDELKDGKGPFSALGQEIFDIYWKYYPKYRSTSKEYVSLDEFLKWYPANQDSIELLYPCDKAEILNKIMSYIADHSEFDFNENFSEDDVVLNVAEDVTLYK